MSGMPDYSDKFDFYEKEETKRLLQIYLDIVKTHKDRFFENKISILNTKDWLAFKDEIKSLNENIETLISRFNKESIALDFPEMKEAMDYLHNLQNAIILVDLKLENMPQIKEEEFASIYEYMKTICIYNDIVNSLANTSKKTKTYKELWIQKEELEGSFREAYEYFDDSLSEEQKRAV